MYNSFSSWPNFTAKEAEAVSKVLLSNKVNYWTGEEGRKFESEFSQWLGCKYSIALANGTVAIELALKALNIGAGDEVITTPRSFFATASSIVAVGATPIFADVDLNTQNITAESIKKVLTRKTRAVIVVHLAGLPADMAPIMSLKSQYGFKIIEDCAQAHGAKYRGVSVGTIGDIGAWSFCQDKIITTGGEGGMVTTNDHDLWLKMWAYKDHGKCFDAVYNKEHMPGFRWLHKSFGTNFRMTEMQAAIGRIQLTLVDNWVRKRQKNATLITEAIKKIPCVRLLKGNKEIVNAYYKYYFFINREKLKNNWSRNKIISEIISRGVPAYHGTCGEIYLEEAFDKTSFSPKTPCINSIELSETSVLLLVHPSLTIKEINTTISVITEVLCEASVT
ncbi:pilin glycosylation protein [Marinomonas sp. MED121]|uniref:DegT/DnrJ/EryC1/StrS family aminotransferase n=1 Tax=Marinomonas sp. MED121 TaxID=314277 RepID=UPI0000690108|nr:DegT/DnrJ/EryC1/StrS aminotransferase family protein [Marinomonas sp. MED121]EAQ65686.1 pilin glycosylation protein [Marinomonas sp. MED121]